MIVVAALAEHDGRVRGWDLKFTLAADGWPGDTGPMTWRERTLGPAAEGGPAVVQRRFHTTDAAEAILADGFRDGTGSYGFVGQTLTGVFVSLTPASINEGAKGEQVLEVTLPDDLDLEPYAIIEEDRPVWEWLIPAEVLNTRATIRLLSDDETDGLVWHHRFDEEADDVTEWHLDDDGGQ